MIKFINAMNEFRDSDASGHLLYYPGVCMSSLRSPVKNHNVVGLTELMP